MFEKLYDRVCKKASVIIEEEKPVSFSGNWKFCDVCLTCIYVKHLRIQGSYHIARRILKAPTF